MRGEQWRVAFGCLGAALFASGVAGMVRAFVFDKGNAKFLDGSETLATFGLILIVGSVLAKYRITVEESYKFGYDVGHDKGYQEGRRKGKPVVVDLHYPRDEVTVRQQPE